MASIQGTDFQNWNTDKILSNQVISKMKDDYEKHRIFSCEVLALGDIFSPNGTELRLPIDGSIDRLRTMCHWVDDCAGSTDSTLYWASAGYAKRTPGVSQLEPHPGRQVSLAEQVSRYLKLLHATTAAEGEKPDIIPAPKLLAKPLCWSTRNEIRVAVRRTQRWMKEHGYINQNSEVIFVVASQWAHLPRIWLYCKWYVPREWGVKLLRSSHEFTHVLTCHRATKVPERSWIMVEDKTEAHESKRQGSQILLYPCAKRVR